MDKVSSPFGIINKQQQKKATDLFLKPGRETLQTRDNLFSKGMATGLSSTPAGFDLTQVPARPQLRTTPQVQCCAKDDSSCSCPKCNGNSEKSEAAPDNDEEQSGQSQSDTETAEQSSTEENSSGQDFSEETSSEQSSTEETAPEPAEASESESVASEQQTTAGLIVEDSATELSDGQMKKTTFLQNLRYAICSTIEPVLATAGQTTEGCPYLNYWLDLYQGKDAAQIERTAKKYAPDINGATTAGEYISIIAQRALRAAVIWAATGKLSGVPDDVPTALPGGKPFNGEDNKKARGAAVQAKAKPGGTKNADDPQAIRSALGEGQPLSSGVRSRMEAAFGMNFSHVRTHTDAAATSLSNDVNARAFTVGNHLAFGNGEYQPGTLAGDALIAHELAHTIQQGSGEGSLDKMETGNAGYDQLEADADQAAIGVLGSIWGGAKNGMKETVQNVIPHLRSGLKLQRCGGGTTPAGPTPKSLRHVSTRHQADATWGYETYITYEVLDTSGNPIKGFDVNEKFGTATYDDATCDWRKSSEGGYTSPTTQFSDHIQGELNTHKPAPQNPQSPLGSHKVQHWPQEWYIGSTTPGKGTKVQTNTFQKYQDHGDHENVKTPP